MYRQYLTGMGVIVGMALSALPCVASCLKQLPCANNPAIPKYRIVLPIGNTWLVKSPPVGAHIDDTLDPANLAVYFNGVMDNWVGASVYLPDDMAVLNDDTELNAFNVQWVSRDFLIGKPNADRTSQNEPLAEGPTNLGDAGTATECSIVGGQISISYNPMDGSHPIYWGLCSGSCLPPLDPSCGYQCVYDLPAVLAHEYGHTLGFTHPIVPTGGTMDGELQPNSSTARAPLTCELDEAGQCYREKFGPARLDSLVADVGTLPTIRWSCADERKWVSYRLVKVDVDGTVWILQDEVPCSRDGAVYAFSDGVSGGVAGTYYLSVRDSLTPALSNLILLGQVDFQGVESLVAHNGAEVSPVEDSSEWKGFRSIEELVNQLDNALLDTEGGLRRRAFSDGFQYVERASRGWGEAIDRALTKATQRCWEDVGADRDEISVDLIARSPVAPGVERGEIDVRYVRASLRQLESAGDDMPMLAGCAAEQMTWVGRLSVLFERTSERQGWKVRRIAEM